MGARRTDMHRLQELVRLHRLGRGSREAALLANGVNLRTVHDLMRHKTAAMTMRYAPSRSERRRAAVGRLLV